MPHAIWLCFAEFRAKDERRKARLCLRLDGHPGDHDGPIVFNEEQWRHAL